MSNRFIDELPSYYRDIREFQELSETVILDWDKLDEAFFNTEKDQFILSSGEAAVAIREKDFGIIADRRVETLAFRKARLLARMQENSTLVYEYLKSILDALLGQSSYEMHLNIDLFEMELFVTPETLYYREAKNLIERIVPLNIALRMARKYRIDGSVYMPSFLSTGSEITLHPIGMDNIEQTIRSNNLAGIKTASTITVTPM
ncbi:putative phage tail protein [Metasolibacillus meyeri]|uniref:putative phage tail protein n=1 Tax=Metasolibacillus meyeri TaxID=1071052 RepID=UPI000D30E796|nr:putative phage tail protein [Metasolibacillus meyeri]